LLTLKILAEGGRTFRPQIVKFGKKYFRDFKII